MLVLGTEGGRLSRHIQQQLEGLWASKRGKQGDKIETAEALKAALDAGGEPWHVIIGPDDFVTNVRFRKERYVTYSNQRLSATTHNTQPILPNRSMNRCFIYANKGAALRALVFQSSPVPDDGTAPFASSSYSSVAATASSRYGRDGYRACGSKRMKRTGGGGVLTPAFCFDRHHHEQQHITIGRAQERHHLRERVARRSGGGAARPRQTVSIRSISISGRRCHPHTPSMHVVASCAPNIPMQAAAVALLLAEHVGEARSGDATSASVALKAREPNVGFG